MLSDIRTSYYRGGKSGLLPGIHYQHFVAEVHSMPTEKNDRHQHLWCFHLQLWFFWSGYSTADKLAGGIIKRSQGNNHYPWIHWSLATKIPEFKRARFNQNVAKGRTGNNHQSCTFSSFQACMATKVRELKTATFHQDVAKIWDTLHKDTFTCMAL